MKTTQLYRETKKETRKWEFQGQILDMLWDCAKEWNSMGGETPGKGVPDLPSAGLWANGILGHLYAASPFTVAQGKTCSVYPVVMSGKSP